MKAIWKFKLEQVSLQEIRVPGIDVKVRSVGVQLGAGNPEACVWLGVDSSLVHETWVVGIAGTGHYLHPIPHWALFVGTYQIGGFVGHVFIWKRSP